MSQALYDVYKQDLILRDSAVDFDTDTIRAILVETGYVFSAAHANFSDLTNTRGDGGDTRADGEALASKTGVNGLCDAADAVFASVTGTNINAFVVYKDTGVDSTSKLLGYFDSVSTISPSAAQVTIQFAGGGIFTF